MALLAGKVAIVTGASSGVGFAAASLFAYEGAAVVVAGRRQSELDRLVETIKAEGGRAVAVAGDVADEAHARALVEAAEDHFGGLDVAFNNAGILGRAGVPTQDVPLSEWQEMLATNLTGAFLGAKYQIPALLKRGGGGSIIFTSSFAGNTLGLAYKAAYAASKAGVVGLTKALAVELGANGIRVNALLPGSLDTPMSSAYATSPALRARIEGFQALRRLGLAGEVANAALYLASDMSSFVTGTAHLVDGGASIYKS